MLQYFSENNFKYQILHITINNMIVDDTRKLETKFDDKFPFFADW